VFIAGVRVVQFGSYAAAQRIVTLTFVLNCVIEVPYLLTCLGEHISKAKTTVLFVRFRCLIKTLTCRYIQINIYRKLSYTVRIVTIQLQPSVKCAQQHGNMREDRCLVLSTFKRFEKNIYRVGKNVSCCYFRL